MKINVEGVVFDVSWMDICSGDTYVAPAPKTRHLRFEERQPHDWQLLTCKYVKDGFVVPQEMAYCYDTHECFKVEGMVE